MALSANLYGGCLVVAAAFVFALVGLVVRKDTLPPLVASEFRFAVCWLLAVFFMVRHGKERDLNWLGPPRQRKLILLRGMLTAGFVILWWTSIRMAPLGDCIAIIKLCPLLTVLLSRYVLKEKMLRTFPIQAFLGLAGVCCIVQPPFLVPYLPWQVEEIPTSQRPDYRLVFVTMLEAAWLPVITRQTKECSWIEVEHVSAALAVFVIHPVVFAFTGVPDFSAIGSESQNGAGLVVLAALGSFAGVALQTQGYQIAEPGKTSMFSYVEILFGYILQVCFTDSAVTPGAIVGASLVLFSCMIGVSEQVRQQRIKEQPDPSQNLSDKCLSNALSVALLDDPKATVYDSEREETPSTSVDDAADAEKPSLA
jgi:drug/metabolite transporter (DMT)-like permease